MTDEVKLYAVKNEDDKLFVVRSNDNAYLYQDQNGNLGRTLYRYYSREDAQRAIERAGHVNQCHVVPLVEKPQPVEVSAKEAEMLERLKSRNEYPAELIHRYVDGSHNFSEWDDDREIRLMRAYVNGWTVEKPKRYVLPMPGTDYHNYQMHGNAQYYAVKRTGNWRPDAIALGTDDAVKHGYTVTQSDIDAAPGWVKAITPVEVTDNDD